MSNPPRGKESPKELPKGSVVRTHRGHRIWKINNRTRPYRCELPDNAPSWFADETSVDGCANLINRFLDRAEAPSIEFSEQMETTKMPNEQFERVNATPLDIHCECGQDLIIPVGAFAVTCNCGRTYARLNGRLGINQFTQIGVPNSQLGLSPSPERDDGNDRSA